MGLPVAVAREYNAKSCRPDSHWILRWMGRRGRWRLGGANWCFLSNIMGAKLWRVGLGWSRFFLTDYLVAIIVVLNFIAVRVIVARLTITNIPLIRAIRMLSLVTFPLYLFHQPLLLFFAGISPSQVSDTTRSIFVIVLTLVVAGAVTPFCELLRGFLMYSFEVVKAGGLRAPFPKHARLAEPTRVRNAGQS